MPIATDIRNSELSSAGERVAAMLLAAAVPPAFVPMMFGITAERFAERCGCDTYMLARVQGSALLAGLSPEVVTCGLMSYSVSKFVDMVDSKDEDGFGAAEYLRNYAKLRVSSVYTGVRELADTFSGNPESPFYTGGVVADGSNTFEWYGAMAIAPEIQLAISAGISILTGGLDLIAKTLGGEVDGGAGASFLGAAATIAGGPIAAIKGLIK